MVFLLVDQFLGAWEAGVDVAFFAVVCSAAYGVSASITRTRQILIEHHEARLDLAGIKGCALKELPIPQRGE